MARQPTAASASQQAIREKILRNIGIISTLATVALLSGCAQQVKQGNQTLGSTSNPQQSSGPVIGSPQPSQAQLAAIDATLTAPMSDKSIAEARREAAPNISKVLRIMSCSPRGELPNRYLNSLADPGTNLMNHVAPAIGMQYHPKGQCLTVTRLDGWRMKAKNAFYFRAVYSSDASGESSTRGYSFIKQPDGLWLLGPEY
ncbi:hypothetical protein [Variovorax rhizosphaerae]|uniref:Uncharacterized protein n=1 Tax=Variovorax rhizosphaerae TaxID=1836200 RepID=A0ABU8WDS0_9BURK